MDLPVKNNLPALDLPTAVRFMVRASQCVNDSRSRARLITMIRVLKSLLLWLLVAALPLQGLAAVMKASCGPAHHLPSMTMQVGTTAHAHSGDMPHDHHSNPGHPHEDGAHEEQHAMHAGAASDTTPAAAAEQQATSSTCGACASCCVGAAAPPGAAIQTPATNLSEIMIRSPISRIAGYVPPSLERPPRFYPV